MQCIGGALRSEPRLRRGVIPQDLMCLHLGLYSCLVSKKWFSQTHEFCGFIPTTFQVGNHLLSCSILLAMLVTALGGCYMIEQPASSRLPLSSLGYKRPCDLDCGLVGEALQRVDADAWHFQPCLF